MAGVVGRIKKRFRKRHKKTVGRDKIRKVWKDYVDIMIIEPLVAKGRVQVDKRFGLEVVGKRLAEDKRNLALITNAAKGNGPTIKIPRRGFTYRIRMVEDRFKQGLLIYEPDKRIKKAVRESLENTNTYYRIENVNK